MTSQERHIYGQHREPDDDDAHRTDTHATVELREEQIAARTRPVEAGRVSVGTEVVQVERTLEVPVTREEVTIERHPVDRLPSDEPVSASAESLSVPVREEQVTVDKQPIVYEEVHLGKRTVEETQRVSGGVRKEVIDIDAEGDVDVADQDNTRRL